MARVPNWLRRAWKPAAALVIVALVARHFVRILARPELDPYPFALRLEYLVPAGVLYLLAHCCWAWFWVRLLRCEGVRVGFFTGLRAYFVSQVGKYVPGKAWVILIRVGLLRGTPGGTPLAVGITATYETLTSMAAGALVGVAFLPWVGVMPEVVARNFAFVFVIAGLPVLLGALNQLAARRVARLRGPDAPPLPSPPLLLLAQGLLQGAVGWCLLGLSLGLTVRAVAPDPPPWELDHYFADLGAVALAYVAGFFILVAPGGLGIRELVLEYALAPQFGIDPALAAAQAAVIALVLRLTWTVAEVIVILGCWLANPGPNAAAPRHPAPDGAGSPGNRSVGSGEPAA